MFKDSKFKKIFLVLLLVVLSALSLLTWHSMPIYPDEIAFRLLSGRYIQDNGLAQKLFYICSSNARATPQLFVIPAWILSWIYLNFSLTEIRLFPIFSVLLAIIFTIKFAVNGRNILAAILSATALIGVSGSGLIIARAEFWQVLNIACCIFVMLKLESSTLGINVRGVLSGLLLFSVVVSIYTHIQGLLFLPLTLFLIYSLVSPKIGKLITATILTVILIYIIKVTVAFKGAACVEYPGIANAINDMVFNLNVFESTKIVDWLLTHFEVYAKSFIYKNHYQINYLPGVEVSGFVSGGILSVLNFLIKIILLVNFILFTYFGFSAILRVMKNSKTAEVQKKNLLMEYVIVLTTFPIIFLFFYDTSQNFYRSFFVNLVISVMLSMFLSRMYLGTKSKWFSIYFYLSGLVVVASLCINLWWFPAKFAEGFEGPSISVNTDWNSIHLDVMQLAKDSGMDLSKGRIIVDDMTYESLKHYPMLYPVTYLDYSGSLTKLPNSEIISIIHPNYAITRCNYMQSWGLKPQRIQNRLCAVNFLQLN